MDEHGQGAGPGSDGGSEGAFDAAVDAAWRRLRGGLADALGALVEGEEVLLAPRSDDEPAVPWCRVTAAAGARLEVTAPSGGHDDLLRVLGFSVAGSTARLGAERREADRVAWAVVRLVREAHGVLDPSFLRPLDGGGDPAPASGGAAGAVSQPRDADFPPADAGPWSLRDGEEVRAAVTRVVRGLLDEEPAWDEDGDLALATERCVLHVVPAARVPRLLLSATLLVEVADEARTLTELNLLNRRQFGLSFALLDDRVVVRRELGVASFVPGEVRAELRRLLDHLDEWVTDLQARVGGRALDEEDAPGARGRPAASRTSGTDPDQQERFAAALAVMKELRAEDRDGLDPLTLLRVFHGDRGLLMLAIAHTRARERAWRTRASTQGAEGRGRAAAVSGARARHHRDLRSRLRRALRISVRGPGPEAAEQLSLFPAEDATG